MCTYILAWQVFPDTPVAVAANRDELLDRPSVPPALLETEPRVVAPRDEEADGTWIGHNEHGLVVAVTNLWTEADLAGERSRGLLVRDTLRSASAEAAARHVESAVEDHEYEGFHVVVADANAAFLLAWDGRLRVHRFDPGVHVVRNAGYDDSWFVPEHRQEPARQQAEDAGLTLAELAVEPGESATAWLERAKTVLADHEYGLCIHRDTFGTRSSSVISVGEGGATYEFAEGPPCETAYERVESQV